MATTVYNDQILYHGSDVMIYVQRDGYERYKAEVDKYVASHVDKVTKEAQALVSMGVKSDRIVYINRNYNKTWGAVYHTFEEFVTQALRIFAEDMFPVGGYDMESMAVNGDDFENVKSLLKKEWMAYPKLWDEYVERMRADEVTNATNGVNKLHVAC